MKLVTPLRMLSGMNGPREKLLKPHEYLQKLEKVKDVWSIFSPLALECFPNFSPPEFLLNASKSVFEPVPENALKHQYAPPRGVPLLLDGLATLLGPTFNNGINASREILITQGANQAILVIFQTFLKPGDVVLVLAPYFDIYEPLIAVTGAKVVSIALEIDPESLESLQAGKSTTAEKLFKFPKRGIEAALEKYGKEACKFIILNSPHNPTGKCWNAGEVKEIGDFILEKTRLSIISDEVYEWLHWGEEEGHVRIANHSEALANRTFTIGSVGKTFGVTGWRIGWVVAPSHYIDSLVAMQARTVFCTNAPLQHALAKCFQGPAVTNQLLHFLKQEQRQAYLKRKKILCDGLKSLGIPYVDPQGSYFVLAHTGRFQGSVKEWSVKNQQLSLLADEEPFDFTVARYLTHVKGVTGIPPSAFFPTPAIVSESSSRSGSSSSPVMNDFIRFCFCKDEQTLVEAIKRLEK